MCEHTDTKLEVVDVFNDMGELVPEVWNVIELCQECFAGRQHNVKINRTGEWELRE